MRTPPAGAVVRPARGGTETPHNVVIHWEPRHRRITITPHPEGTSLRTAEAREEVSAPCIVHIDPPAHVSFDVGSMHPHEVDVSYGWTEDLHPRGA